ncbi:hypothetical protein M0802_010907 [Mischocyttarus mexicanus]|nr:hypothetical protein M0802_010907 [Mischocyttarus mexicanus]
MSTAGFEKRSKNRQRLLFISYEESLRFVDERTKRGTTMIGWLVPWFVGSLVGLVRVYAAPEQYHRLFLTINSELEYRKVEHCVPFAEQCRSIIRINRQFGDAISITDFGPSPVTI